MHTFFSIADDSLDEILSTVPSKARIFWFSNSKEGISIPFDGIPFLSFGGKWYQCHQGEDIDAREKDKRKEKKDRQQVSSFLFLFDIKWQHELFLKKYFTNGILKLNLNFRR